MPIVTLLPDIDELATGYFFSKYVHENRGNICAVDDGNGCLLASIHALGAAGVTQGGNGPSASPKALSKYLQAIQLVNAALRSPDLLKRDSTLLSINILSIFETVTGFHRSMSSWRDHVNGGAALLHLRGAEQFETQTGGRLFLHTVTNLVLGCMQSRQAIPRHVWETQALAEEYITDINDRIWRYSKAIMRFNDLHARLLPGNRPRRAAEAPSIIVEALDIDKEFEAIFADPTGLWQYDTFYDTGPTVFAGYYHVYHSFSVAQIYNANHGNRILLRDVLYKAIDVCPVSINELGLSDAEIERLRSSATTVSQLQLDILASVPQHLGSSLSGVGLVSKEALFMDFAAKHHNPFKPGRRPEPALPHVRLSGGYLIQWKLYVAGCADAPGGRIRMWVTAVLRLLAQAMGIQQAQLLADSLESRGNQLFTYHWQHYKEWERLYEDRPTGFLQPEGAALMIEP